MTFRDKQEGIWAQLDGIGTVSHETRNEVKRQTDMQSTIMANASSIAVRRAKEVAGPAFHSVPRKIEDRS